MTEASADRTKEGAPATHALLAVLAIAHGVQLLLIRRGQVTSERLLDVFGISAQGIFEGNVWQPLTSLFTHRGPLPLLWDLMILYVGGRLLEQVRGPRAMIRAWLGCGVLGALGAVAFPASPVAGCGPANIGVLLSLAVHAPRLPVHSVVFTLRAQWIVAILVGFEVLLLGIADDLAANRVSLSWQLFFGGLTGVVASTFWPRVVKPPLDRYRLKRERRRQVLAIERSLMEEPELDRILEKIAREGMQRLTPAERRFLRRASTRYDHSPRS